MSILACWDLCWGVLLFWQTTIPHHILGGVWGGILIGAGYRTKISLLSNAECCVSPYMYIRMKQSSKSFHVVFNFRGVMRHIATLRVDLSGVARQDMRTTDLQVPMSTEVPGRFP